MMRLKRITSKGVTQMFCLTGPSRCLKRLSCYFILKSLVSLAKTEKSSKDTMLLQTNI